MHMLILKQICNTYAILYDIFLNEMDVLHCVLHPKKLWVERHNPFLMKLMLPHSAYSGGAGPS